MPNIKNKTCSYKNINHLVTPINKWPCCYAQNRSAVVTVSFTVSQLRGSGFVLRIKESKIDHYWPINHCVYGSCQSYITLIFHS